MNLRTVSEERLDRLIEAARIRMQTIAGGPEARAGDLTALLAEQRRRALHHPRYSRRRLGRAPISGRPLYGWAVRCACGWEHTVNGAKRDLEQLWRAHRRGA